MDRLSKAAILRIFNGHILRVYAIHFYICYAFNLLLVGFFSVAQFSLFVLLLKIVVIQNDFSSIWSMDLYLSIH